MCEGNSAGTTGFLVRISTVTRTYYVEYNRSQVKTERANEGVYNISIATRSLTHLKRFQSQMLFGQSSRSRDNNFTIFSLLDYKTLIANT